MARSIERKYRQHTHWPPRGSAARRPATGAREIAAGFGDDGRSGEMSLCTLIYNDTRDPYILNPHPQFEPGTSASLLVQHNRGGRYTPDGRLERLVGPEGATLYLLSVENGQRTELTVGKPYTTPATGHEAWIGTTKEVLLTVAASGGYAPEKGNLLGVRAGAPARTLGSGYRFNHVGVSRCGRFFCCDDWQGSYKVVVGSIRTRRSTVLCASKTKPSRSQNTHPHAYLTPDLKWVIFNSTRSGFPHLYAAAVPDGTLDELEKA